MNIFALSKDPAFAAVWQCDQHVGKMPLETAQMLSTVWQLYSGRGENYPLPQPCYKLTHEFHPCVDWACETDSNYRWLVAHGRALVHEHMRRFGHSVPHKSYAVLQALREPPANMPSGPLAPFAIGFAGYPELIVPGDPVASYRNYYRERKLSFKNGPARWTNSQPPAWLGKACSQPKVAP